MEHINAATMSAPAPLDATKIAELVIEIGEKADAHLADLMARLVREENMQMTVDAGTVKITLAGITVTGRGAQKVAIINWANKARREIRNANSTQLFPDAEFIRHGNERSAQHTFQKKPVVIEAFQMTKARRWDNEDWPHWLHDAWQKEDEPGSLFCVDGGEQLFIRTLEGDHQVTFDDWIIQGVKGELYPCKPDIFEETYEAIVVA